MDITFDIHMYEHFHTGENEIKVKNKKAGYRGEKERLGRFILATSDSDLDPDTLLDWYKEQGAVERGFRFLKDNSFHISEIYLKNPNRVAAVSMLMVLSLMVYTVTQWQIREILKQQKKTVRDVKKQTDKPTTKRIYHLFRRVRQIEEVNDTGVECRILDYTDELQDITRLFGQKVFVGRERMINQGEQGQRNLQKERYVIPIIFKLHMNIHII